MSDAIDNLINITDHRVFLAISIQKSIRKIMAVAIKEETKNSSNLQVIKGKRLSKSIGRSKYSSNKWEEKDEAGKSIGKENGGQRQEWF